MRTGVYSSTDVGTGKAKDEKAPLSEIISVLNERFGTEFDEEDRRLTGQRLLTRYSIAEIRAKSMENLARWRRQGAWSPAYDEWQHVISDASDATLRHILVGRDEVSNRLRRSMPYVGLLSCDEIRSLNAGLL